MLLSNISRNILALKCVAVRSIYTMGGISRAAKQTIQETVNPYSKIQINGAYNLKIVPYDLLDCPDSNVLRATVERDDGATGITVQVADALVTITGDPKDTNTNCLLEIPIKADLKICNHGSTSIVDLYSDDIEVNGTGNIDTKSLRSTNIKLCSTSGNIACRGITLAQNVVATTSGNGNIFLDKLQGGSVSATTEGGKITVNSSYSNESSFQTTDGDLELKSIHKVCSVRSSGGKNLVMNGFYGTLDANVASENVTLQLSEMVGQSSIRAAATRAMQLNLAETVFETSSVSVTSPKLELDSSVDDGKVNQREGNSCRLGNAGAENKLHVETGGSVVLRKMSWADSFSFGDLGRMEQ